MTPHSLHAATPDALSRVSVVLVEPSHPGNVGAAARAMRVMGLRDLVLVAPRVPHAHEDPQAIAFASGATPLLERARLAPSLEAALADVSLAVAISADPREFGPPPLAPENAARRMLDELAADGRHRAALVFGTERTGLSIEHVSRCQLLCSIPGDPQYHSLNLAQAVQVLAYVLRREATADLGRRGDEVSTGAPEPARLASQQAIEGFYAHLERALRAIGFLDPAHPKKLMPRLRRLFARTRLEVEEVDLLRGICKMTELAGRANPPAWMGGRNGSDNPENSRQPRER